MKGLLKLFRNGFNVKKNNPPIPTSSSEPRMIRPENTGNQFLAEKGNNEVSFKELHKMVQEYTLLDYDRLFSLKKMADDLNKRGIAGDFVECGCYKGGSSAVLRSDMGADRRLWIYDSFQGMPNPGQQDGQEAQKWKNQCAASVDCLLTILLATGATWNEFVVREGWFEDTFKSPLPKQVALLHCDADWYESVKLVLETFYPLMPDGAYVILDDFGYWEGCRLAFYDFCENHGERPLLERVGPYQAYWIKGKKHTRNEI
jgi:O-methyltransferase